MGAHDTRRARKVSSGVQRMCRQAYAGRCVIVGGWCTLVKLNLFATKPIERILAEAEGGKDLKRSLSGLSLIALGIGAIIGAGIFTLTGVAAAQNAGPAIVYSFILAAVACAFAGICYSEFSTMIPTAGSAYVYAYATVGELLAWIIGWALVLEYAVGAATVAVSWSATFVSILHSFGIDLPPSVLASPFDGAGGTIVNLPAAVIIALVSLILIIGIQESARFNSLIVILKVTVVILFIGVGYFYINRANYTPFLPENTTGQFGAFGWSGVLRAAGQIFFAYIGFDAVSTAAQEAKNPQKDMPIGILGSLVVCTILYILVSLVLTGLVSYKTLNVAAPVALAMDATGVSWGSMLVKIGAVFGLATVMLVMLLGQTRVFYSMSRDGLLPKAFSAIHPKFRTPWITTIVFGMFAAIMPAFLPIGKLAELVNIGTLLAFTIVCAGVWVLRVRSPELPRPFKTPLVPLVPILGILSAGYLMTQLARITWIVMISWLLVGLLIYFFYSVKHSKVQKLPESVTGD